MPPSSIEGGEPQFDDSALFRRLKGAELLLAVYAGEPYKDGMKRPMSPRQPLAAWPERETACGLSSGR